MGRGRSPFGSVVFFLLFELSAEPNHVLNKDVGLLLQLVALRFDVAQFGVQVLNETLMIRQAQFRCRVSILSRLSFRSCALEVD